MVCFVAIFKVNPPFQWTGLTDFIAYTNSYEQAWKYAAQFMMLVFGACVQWKQVGTGDSYCFDLQWDHLFAWRCWLCIRHRDLGVYDPESWNGRCDVDGDGRVIFVF
jgi:hypothetical protein